MNLLLALLGGLGVLLIWTGVTHPFVAHIGGLRRRVQLKPNESEHVELSPLLDRSIGPLLDSASHALAILLRREDKDRELISAAGYPPRYRTVFNLYAWKAFIALMLFLVGLVNALIIGPGFLPVALGLGILGLYLPDFHLRQLVQRRREMLRTEMAFVLHRLAIQVAAGQALPQALEQIALKPGGPFIQELRQVSTDISTGHTLSEALDRLTVRAAGVDEVRRFVDLIERAQQLGSPIAEALTSMGRIMQERVQQDIEARGMAASVQMVLPVGCLILPAIGIVVMGPGIYLAAQYFFLR
jgi:tight adherence protein C